MTIDPSEVLASARALTNVALEGQKVKLASRLYGWGKLKVAEAAELAELTEERFLQVVEAKSDPGGSSEVVVGIVCTGNIRRSPVAGAWLHHWLIEQGIDGIVAWSAGFNVTDVGGGVKPEALAAAESLEMARLPLARLRKHESRSLEVELGRTDLLIWITNPLKINAFDATDAGPETAVELGPTRAERMLHAAQLRQAVLLVIGEADEARKKKYSPGVTYSEICQAYLEQSEKLRGWARHVARLLPEAG